MITFHALVEGGVPPRRADAAAMGTLPTNGFRYCEPVRTASAFGWYVFLPLDLHVIWDGFEFRWSLDEGENWYLLTEAIQYPGFAARFDAAAPEAVQGYAPPFLTRTNDNGILQIWTGIIARTAEGIGAYVRGPVNIAGPGGAEVLEGVIQTDWWCGPLFANLRFTRPGEPVVFRANRPFLQVQPFQQALWDRFKADAGTLAAGLFEFGPDEWDAYRATVVHRMETREKLGDYAVDARKRAKRKGAEDGPEGA